MPEKRMIRLGAFMRPVGIHTAWWRYPGAYPDANFNLKHIARFARKLEAGRFDAFFMADHLAVLNMPMAALKRSATVTSFDPMALLPALAMVTERLGLIATGSTTFDAPYHVARRFASLDHVSEGRAGWNIVTTSNPDSALNFGLDDHMEHDERYRRAREFFDVVTGLWDSFADDAFIRDVESGIYFDPERMHVLDHKGKYFKVRGPLNIARPVQGWPLIVQAGASDSGRQLAAETAEMIFSPGGPIADCQRYYNDIKARAAAAGRDPEHVKILPGCLVVVGDTDEEARAKRAKLDSLVHPDSGIASLSIALGVDASTFDLDGLLPDIPETNQSKSGRQRVVDRARRDNLTVRQLAQVLGAYGGLAMVGTAKTVADKMEEYFDQRACDGFNIMFPWVPGGLDEFVDLVVPELQRRGVFRKEYEGKTLRENLGAAPAEPVLPRDERLPMKPRLGGHILADALVAQGIDHVFEVPGESFLDTLDGLHDTHDKLKLVTCRFEAGAVNMAEAYGKLKGRPAAAMVTRGPGACHGSIGVHIAMQDSTPMLLFVGQIPHEDTGRDAFQEVDYRQMFAPLAKWVTQIDHAHRIPEVVAHAVDVAVSGRPGPVVIALSEEMQKHTVSVPDLPGAPVSVAHPDPAALRKMREMIAAAKRPIAVVGGSCWTDDGRAALGAFLVKNDIAVTVGFRRQSHYDGAQANFAGDLGVGSDPGLIGKFKEADLILALGSRLGDAVTQGYTLLDMAGPGAGAVPIIQVLPDGAEIGRVFRPALGIVSDLNVFAHAVAALEPVTPSWSAWTRDLRSLREAQRAVPNYDGSLNLGTVMRELETMLTADAIVTTDAGNFAGWATRFLNFSDRQRYIGPTNGAMGYSVPAAIGASITFPGRMVVSMVGDGGFMMTGQELATAFHHGATPIVLVFNNNQFGTIRMHQERAYPWRVSGTQVTNPDFSKYIQAFGGHGEVVSDTAAFAAAFRRAMNSGKPAVIELRMNPDEITTRATVADFRAGKTPPADMRPDMHPDKRGV